MIPLISEELKIGKHYIGFSLSLGMLGALIASFVSVYFIAKFGVKNIIYFGLLLNLAGSVVLFFLPSYLLFTIAYFAIQFGYSAAFISILTAINNTFKNNKVRAILKIDLGYFTGLTITPLVLSLFFFLKVDWHWLFLCMLIPQIILLISMFFLDIPQNNKNDISATKNSKIDFKVIKNPVFIFCILIIFLNAAMLNTFYDWFTTYFGSIYKNISYNFLFLSAYSFSILAGLLLKNKLINYFKDKKILLFNGLFSFISLTGILLFDLIALKVIMVFLLGFSLSGNFDFAASIALEYFDDKSDSICMLLVSSIYIGIITFQYLDGFFTEKFSTYSMLYINFILSFIFSTDIRLP
ncbi:MAG: MFS transporter, partial [Actinobacteria bacterium]|nr:MFS transporter [Actinomycetota bacterium]